MRFLALSLVFFLSLSAAADQVFVNSKGTIPTPTDLDKCEPIKSLFDGIEKDNSNIQFKFHCKAKIGEAVLFRIASRLNFPESDVIGPVTISGTPLIFTDLKVCKDYDTLLKSVFVQIRGPLSQRHVEFNSSGCLQTEQGIILATYFSKH